MSSSSAVSPSEYAVGSTHSAERSTRPDSSFMSDFTSGKWLVKELTRVLTTVSTVLDHNTFETVVQHLGHVARESENKKGRITAILVLAVMASKAAFERLDELRNRNRLGTTGANVVNTVTWLRGGNFSDPTRLETQSSSLHQVVEELPAIIFDDETLYILNKSSQVIRTLWATVTKSFAAIKATPENEVRQRYARPLPSTPSGTTRQELREHAQHQQAKNEAEAEASTKSKKKQKRKPRHK